jgi:hypothetical protein
LAAFVRQGEEERGLRGSTPHEYRAIGERLDQRPWRSLTWADRPLYTFAPSDVTAVRRELIGSGRSPDTLHLYRRVLLGAFGTAPSSPAQAWPWSGHTAESEGKLRFDSPAKVRQLVAGAHNDVHRAVSRSRRRRARA